jgi:hypothetical protein
MLEARQSKESKARQSIAEQSKAMLSKAKQCFKQRIASNKPKQSEAKQS